MIRQGRVAVNGEVVTGLGTRIDRSQDTITVDGKPVAFRNGCVYYLLHKPVGYITTLRDPQGRPTVVELIPPAK